MPSELRLKITSDPANLATVRRSIERFCADHGLDQQSCDEIGLCVNEAVANIIRHAYAGAREQPIEIAVNCLDRGEVRIAIRDWGNGLDPERLPQRKYEPLEPGGLGMICLKQMMQQVRYTPQAGGGMLLEMMRRRRE